MKKPLHPYLVNGYCISKRIQKIFFSPFIFLAILFLFSSTNSSAQNLPGGFSQVLVASGISNPTVMAFAPDGRIFVGQQSGQLRVIKNGSLLSQPFISLSVHSSGERGLLGIAFDPNFNSNKYIYLYYTLSSGAYNRISRFTANGDVVLSGSEQVILNLDPLSSATNHNGGNMQFGADGKLYVGVGDNADAVNALIFDTYHGKILRINPDGSVPPGNPFSGGSAQQQRIWAYGLRNPYTLAIQPGTGRIFVNDVGGSDWEEINDASTGGRHFDWPYSEGYGSNSRPIYAYGHGSSVGTGCAITGGTFFNPSTTNYPSTYTGRYFYLDFCGRWIDMLTLSGTSATRSNFASNIAGSPVSLVTGIDGNLYFLSRDNSAVYKIVYTGSSTAPLITSQPQSQSVSAGNNATFTVTATGTAPLSYQWRKNGTNISGATASSYTITTVDAGDAGNYSVVVINPGGTVVSNNATLTVTSSNQAPTANIMSPATGSTYAGGTLINFNGTATDPESGNLSASAYNWYVLFYHDTHNHPGPAVTASGSSGSFTVPNTGETAYNVFYRLFLVVTDPQGAKDTVYRDIMPRTSTITLNTNPQGLGVTLDGQPYTAPLTVTSVEGVIRSIGVSSPQSLSGSTYNFSSWAHGGSQTQNIATPINNTVYTASFVAGAAAPVITSQPQSVTVTPGSTATFNVTASGTAPLSYQWRKNGSNISGATGASYSMSSITTANAGTYSVVVSNSSGSATSNNATLTVSSTSEPAYNIFTSTAVPNNPRNNDGQGIVLGVKFRSTQNGFVTGVRYYKGTGTTGTHTGSLWSATGTLLAQATFTNETSSGWQQVLFSSPVAVTAGVTYVASYFSSSGDYAFTNNYFTQAVINGPLRALANGEEGPNGLYRYSTTPVFPSSGYQASNYWADVIFTTAGDIIAPTVSSVSPANGATNVNTATNVTATFSEAVNGATVTGTTFQLKNGSTVLPAAVSTSGSTITLIPSSALASSTTYTITIKGGSLGVKDPAGNALANDYNWTFTTAASGGNPGGSTTYTVFKTTDSPTQPRNNDGTAIELGMKFRTTQNGYITGIRYYKVSGTTGTHTGRLWTSTGTQLAAATFTGETASGWQQVLLSTPVAVTAGVTYVVSYFSSSGDYAFANNYFTQAVVNGPLRALANGEDGPNGLYKYSTVSAFPTSSYNATHYWVDVVFSTGSGTASRSAGQTITNTDNQAAVVSDETLAAEELELRVMPNPSNSYFNLAISGKNRNPVTVRVFDMSGQIVEKHEKIAPNSNLQVGRQWISGTYFVEVRQDGRRKFMKVVKVN